MKESAAFLFWTLRPDTSLLWILLLSSQHMMLTAQMIRMAGKCLIYAESKLSALNRPCSVSFIIQSQLLPLVLHVFERSLKCDDNSHKHRDKNCHLQQNASLPLPPNFFFVLDSPAACLTRRPGYSTTRAQADCTWSVMGAAHPDLCHTISFPLLS